MNYGANAYGAVAYGGTNVQSIAYDMSGNITIVTDCSASMYVDIWQERLYFNSTVLLNYEFNTSIIPNMNVYEKLVVGDADIVDSTSSIYEFSSSIALDYEFFTKVPD